MACNITEIQDALLRHNLDGWLFFDHHFRDPLAYKILGLGAKTQPSRRWYFFIPLSGPPRKLVHRIESRVLGDLTGEAEVYSGWVEQQEKLAQMLAGCRRIAMQYSPDCAIPYVSLVDAGTLDLVRKYCPEVLSSANLIQEFEARWSSVQLAAHLEAGRRVDRIRREAFDLVGERLRNRQAISEYNLQQFILTAFERENLFAGHGPIVAVNDNASDPHYEPTSSSSRLIRENDVLLIDLWAKLKAPDAVYYDITWTGFCGLNIPSKAVEIFEIVKGSRQAAVNFVKESIENDVDIYGWQVDDVARGFIAGRKFGDFFFHRTGHNIGTEVHGNGANMDNLESHDERQVISNTCFSVEPGIYLPNFGIRSEVNVFVGERQVWVTGEEQEHLVRVFS